MTRKLFHANTLFVTFVGVMAGGLLLSQALSAPPGPAGAKPPPKKPTAAPKAKPTSPRPPQRRSGVRPPAKASPRPARYVRKPHYWQPRFAVAPPTKTWTTIGYPFYVGGSSYVITPPSTVIEAPAKQTLLPPEGSTTPPPPEDSAASADDEVYDEMYAQILELTDLVHEWRTLNESPALHERLSLLSESDSGPRTLASIQRANQRFDEYARAAAYQLALGESADDELDDAARQLDKLSDLADALPLGATETKAAGQP